MKITSLITLTITTGLILLAYSPASYSSTFFTCSPGYVFKTNGDNSAVCFKAEQKEYQQPLKCPHKTITAIKKSIGHFLQRDYQGIADKCVGTFKLGPVSKASVLDMSCPRGYKLDVKSGADLCYKIRPAQSIAPSIKVAR